MRFVGAGLLGAKASAREKFTGIGQIVGIKRATHQLHSVEIRLGVHHRHEFFFLLADAVLAGDGSANANAQSENVARKFLGALFLSFDGAVVKNQRVEIAVSSMKDVSDS